MYAPPIPTRIPEIMIASNFFLTGSNPEVSAAALYSPALLTRSPQTVLYSRKPSRSTQTIPTYTRTDISFTASLSALPAGRGK